MEPRIVPINNTLLPILDGWIPEGRYPGGPRVLNVNYIHPKASITPTRSRTVHQASHLRGALETALAESGLRPLTWYQATRHTFASHWVMDGRLIEKLRNILGHSSVDVTERYAHLAPDVFSPADYDAVAVDFSDPVVLDMQAHRGEKMEATNRMATERQEGDSKYASK